VDALLSAVVQAAPSWGVGGLLLTYVLVLLRREARVDASHADALERQDRRHTAALERLQRDHDDEVAQLDAKIRELRRQVNALDEALTQARVARLGLQPLDPVRRTIGRAGDVSEEGRRG
jgi:septal ring factor EnvC (AmiA/AmiB activator)